MFNDHFEIFLADTEESKKIHYRIRYQVYCEELGYENKGDFPNQMEFDEDDNRSVHFIIRNTQTRQWVGTVRLINKQDNLLPIEQNGSLNQDIHINDLFGAVELSRLCLIKDVRRNKDIDPPHGIGAQDSSKSLKASGGALSQNKLNRLIIWGLFHAVAEYCQINKKQYCYFMTTKILAKVLKIGGLKIIKIGEGIDHKGQRFPFKLDAIAAYYSDIWQSQFNSFQLFSESNNFQHPSAA